jgi:hypothetical protein
LGPAAITAASVLPERQTRKLTGVPPPKAILARLWKRSVRAPTRVGGAAVRGALSQHFRHHRQACLRLGRRLRVEDAGADEDRLLLRRRPGVCELEAEDAAARVVAADEREHPPRRVLRFGQRFAVGDVPAVLSKFGRLVAERQVVQSQQLRRFAFLRGAGGDCNRREGRGGDREDRDERGDPPKNHCRASRGGRRPRPPG